MKLAKQECRLRKNYLTWAITSKQTVHCFELKPVKYRCMVQSFHMIAKAVTPLPAAKDEVVDGQVVRHATLNDPETRFRQRYADLAVNPQVREIFRSGRTV